MTTQTNFLYRTKLCIFLFLMFLMNLVPISAQDSLKVADEQSITVKGIVVGSVSKQPIGQALLSVAGTSKSVSSNENGEFSIPEVSPDALINVQYPGYHTQRLYLNGRTELDIYLVDEHYRSNDEIIAFPFDDKRVKDYTGALSYFLKQDMDNTAVTSWDQALKGKTAGVGIFSKSGMPGSVSTVSVRGPSTIFGRNEPLVIIDGSIYETQYITEGAIDGFVYNPMDVVDIDDIEGLTITKDGQLNFGSMGANGVITINTEEKKETSSAIRFHMYQGVVAPVKQLEVMDVNQFNNYLNDQIASANLSQAAIAEQFPWLAGGPNLEYSHNTHWQDEIFTPGRISKYHIFLKGGDEIGTLNMSVGYMDHKGIIENTRYQRFNLRLNAKINITPKFSFIPNVKLSTSDSYLKMNGINAATNPLLAANIKPPIMRPFSVTGRNTSYINDVGAFKVSNPVAIIEDEIADNRNYHFLASGRARYEFSDKWEALSNIGIN
jgi:hypothetical protein